MAYDFLEGKDYTQVMSAAARHLDRFEERGGHYRLLADVERSILTAHQPVDKEVGQSCEACGQPWPCRTVYNVVGPTDKLTPMRLQAWVCSARGQAGP